MKYLKNMFIVCNQIITILTLHFADGPGSKTLDLADNTTSFGA
jgi:hypothetical protein